MDPLSAAGFGLNAAGSLYGLLSAGAARRRAQAARDLAIQDLSQSLGQEQRDMEARDAHGLMAATGLGGDAIRTLGSNMGAGLANAGVYNSSATAGALTQANADIGAQLSSLASSNRANELAGIHANQRYLAGLKTGIAGGDLQNARQDQQNAWGGFGNLLYQLPSLFNNPQQNQNQNQQFDPSAANAGVGGIAGYDPSFQPQTTQDMWNGQLPSFNTGMTNFDLTPRFTPGNVQSNIQSMTAGFRPPSSRSYGYAMNGMQNGEMPVLKARGLRPYQSMPSY